jgi:cell division transport system permease protein
MAGVADVRYDRQWIERLMNTASFVRVGGLTLAAILVFAAALTVASVVRLALIARLDEIHIMQLVGSPLAYIRGPFVVEGLIEGGSGAVMALVVLWLTFLFIRTGVSEALTGGVVPVFLSIPMSIGLLMGGMIVGCAGGFIAARSARESVD